MKEGAVNMGFAMRMKFGDIIKTESFKSIYINGSKEGFEFKVQLAYYRGHYLSDIEILEVYVDGEKMPDEAVTFTLREKEMPIYKLKYAMTEFWSQVEPGTISVVKSEGLTSGKHELELKLILRVPYMAIGKDHNYMPLDSGEKVTIEVPEEGNIETKELIEEILKEKSGIKLGATLFCYGTEYAKYEYDFEECVKQAALAGATGYEIVATQMIPSYPNVSDEFLGTVKRLKETYGIGPVGYGANNDRGMHWNRDLTDDEMLADAIIDLKSANKLSCKVMRAQYMLSPKAFERLEPYAKIFDVKVGIEIHNPETPKSPKMLEYLEVIKRTQSKYLGFVPDFGCFAVAPNKPQWDKALAAGVKEEHLQLIAKLRSEGVSLEKAREEVEKVGAHPAIQVALQGMYGFVQFRPKEQLAGQLEDLKEILPYCFEMHGKFHYLSEDGEEPSIPYKEILEMLKKSDFNGYLICEYEDELGCGGTEFTKRQIKMEKRILGENTYDRA